MRWSAAYFVIFSRGSLGAGFDRRIIDIQIHSIGIDLGKKTFHLVALGAAGKVLLKKSLSANNTRTMSSLEQHKSS